ncbi:MAG: hypothetical protein M1830_004361, partial [Pleopsidium flavum]
MSDPANSPSLGSPKDLPGNEMSGNRADLEDYQVAKIRLKERVAAALKRGRIPVEYNPDQQYVAASPILVRTSRTALDLDTPLYDAEAYVMYTSPDLKYEDRLRHSIISICYRKIPGVSSKFSITPENGFIELAPGKTIKREVRLECRMFKRFLKPGEKHYLLYTGAGYRNVIQYWRYGTLE